jgi:uncharacterized BrkB/YihY/UPF0761 family membrane protein
MKKLIRNISLFDVLSTFSVLAVLAAMLFVGGGQQASAALLDEADCPDDVNCNSATDGEAIRQAILDLINFVLTFVGIIAVAFIIYAGFLMLTAGGNEEQIENGKKIIIWASVGILVILFSWVIIAFVVDLGTGSVTGADV